MSGFWRDLFKNTERVVQLGHAQLGLLQFDPEEEVWISVITRGARHFRFLIAGDVAPDPQLMECAAGLLANYDGFQRSIVAFLESEIASRPQIGDEIRKLEVSDICFFWPNRPNSAMVFFGGPNPDHVWHCDYLGGRPSCLSFDS